MLRGAAIWVAFLGVSVLAALPSLLDSQIVYEPGALPEESFTKALDAGWSADQLVTKYGGPLGNEYAGADLTSYLAAARRWIRGEGFSHMFVPLWPPGMVFWSAAILTLFGGGGYVRGMILGSALLWSLALFLVHRSARPTRSTRWWVFAFAGFFLLLPALRGFLFGFGSLMSEAPSHAFFVAGTALLVRGLLSNHRGSILGASGCIAAAALLRALFDYIALSWFVGLPLVLAAAWALHTLCLSTPGNLPEAIASLRAGVRARPILLRLTANLLLAFVVYQGALLPWRVYKHVNFRQHGLVDFDPKYAWSWSWMTDDELPRFHRSGNAACHVDFRLCTLVREHRAELSGFHLQKLAVATFLNQPGRWWSFKAKHLDWFWFGREWSSAFFERPLIGIEGLLLFFLGLAALGVLAARLLWRGDR